MGEGTCAYCGATLEPGAVFCIACGARVVTPVTAPVSDTPSWAPAEVVAESSSSAPSPACASHDSEDETFVVEDDGPESASECAPWAAPVEYGAGEPEATIIEELEPITACIRLEIVDIEAGSQTVEFELEDGAAFTLGRDGRITNYMPEDPRASRRHFSIGVAPEGPYLTDLGSSNGTYVNGNRVTETVWLGDGDKIEYGRSSAVVRVIRLPERSSTDGGVLYL